MNSWRFIDTGSLSGPENMAIDEALLTAFDPAQSLPVLRLYGWNPPTLSLGRFQKAAEVLELERCAAVGVPVVRRITGGGIIYHADELTYSIVCAPHQIPATASIKESFRVLTGFLLDFYRALGLDAGYAVDMAANKERLGERTPFCFAGKESFDVMVNGRKIGGNAQRRLKNVIFQHGSIPLLNRVSEGARFLREVPEGLTQGVICLAETGVNTDQDRLGLLLAQSFARCFDVVLQPEGLNGQEELEVVALRRRKYDNSRWNLEGEES